MREVPLPPPELPPLQRSVVSALAAILEIDAAEVPVPGPEHPAPWTVWRTWLAGRGLGLVPVREPARLQWPGPWLAVLRADGTGECIGAVAFGSPPGLLWSPLAGRQTFDDICEGYVLAPLDIALATIAPTTEPAPDARTTGRVELLAIAAAAERPMTLVDEVTAQAGRGLRGDRYYDARGTFSDPHGNGHDLTLIEAEVLDALALPSGPIAPEQARRNVVTRGIDLNALVGRRFTVGAVECVGRRLCEPCAHLQRLTVAGTLRALVHRGGLRADVLSDGVIRVGDDVIAAA